MIAWALVVCLAGTDAACAAPAGPAASAFVPAAKQAAILPEIPDAFGTITDRYRGNSGKTVFFIQDAHDSFEAQQNIASILSLLVSRHGVQTVYEEGYEGPVPTDRYFGTIREPELRKNIAYYLMDKLRLGGAEFAHITRTKDFKLIGVDKIRLHLAHIESYRASAGAREAIREDLRKLRAKLDRLANRYFSTDFKTWFRWKERSERGELSWPDYLARVGTFEKEKGPEAGVLFEDFPALAGLFRVLRDPAAREADPPDLARAMQELSRWERAFAARELKDPSAQKVYAYLRGIAWLERLAEVRLTAEEFKKAGTVLQGLRTSDMARFIAEHSGKAVVLSRAWEDLVRHSLEFYRLAVLRDRAVDQIFRDLVPGPQETRLALVFGGFHETAIKKILREKGFSYTVITPRIGQVSHSHRELYKRLMAGSRYGFEVSPPLRRAARVPGFYELPVPERIRDRLVERATSVMRRGMSPSDFVIAMDRGRGRAEVRSAGPAKFKRPKIRKMPIPVLGPTEAEKAIRREILQSPTRSIPFSRFMELSLYYRDGFYETHVHIGSGGGTDFYTMPVEHPEAFAALLAKQYEEMWWRLGRPGRFQIIEMGAGSGVMARETLQRLREYHPDLYAAMTYGIVEKGTKSERDQKMALVGYEDKVSVIKKDSASDLSPESGILNERVPKIFASNELLDVFSVDRVLQRNGALYEVHVGIGRNGKLVEKLRPLTGADERQRGLLRYLEFLKGRYEEVWAAGGEVAVSLELEKWQTALAKILDRDGGYVITIDYGYIEPSVQSLSVRNFAYDRPVTFAGLPIRSRALANGIRKIVAKKYEWLKAMPAWQRAFARGALGLFGRDDRFMYKKPGRVDITWDVDYLALMMLGAYHGLAVEGSADLSDYFSALGTAGLPGVAPQKVEALIEESKKFLITVQSRGVPFHDEPFKGFGERALSGAFEILLGKFRKTFALMPRLPLEELEVLREMAMKRRAELRSSAPAPRLAEVLRGRFAPHQRISFFDIDTGQGDFLRAFPKHAFDIVTANNIFLDTTAERARELVKEDGLFLATIEANDVFYDFEDRIVRHIEAAGFSVEVLDMPADYPAYESQFNASRWVIATPVRRRAELRSKDPKFIDLVEVEKNFRDLETNFWRIREKVGAGRTFDDGVIHPMLYAYRKVNEQLASGRDVKTLLRESLWQMNVWAHFGDNWRMSFEYQGFIETTRRRFAEHVGPLFRWLEKHVDDSPWKLASGIYDAVLATQLFDDGNHRTGALAVSLILMHAGIAPFVLTFDNALSYFEISADLKFPARGTKKFAKIFEQGFKAALGHEWKDDRRRFQEFLKENTDRRFVTKDISRAGVPAEILNKQAAEKTKGRAEVRSDKAAGQGAVKKAIQFGMRSASAVGWAGFAVTLPFVLFAMPGIVYLHYLPIAVEGWLISMLLYRLTRQEDARVTIAVMAAGVAVLFAVFHVALPALVPALAYNAQAQTGETLAKIGLRLAGLFVGIWFSRFADIKFFKKEADPASTPLRTALRWALSDGLVLGYFFYAIFYPFMGAQIPVALYFPFLANFMPETIAAQASTAWLKIGFDLTLVTFFVHGPMMVLMGSIVGEKKQNALTRPLYRSVAVRDFMRMYPVNFVALFVLMGISWFLDPSGGYGVSATHAVFAMGYAILRRWLFTQEPVISRGKGVQKEPEGSKRSGSRAELRRAEEVDAAFADLVSVPLQAEKARFGFSRARDLIEAPQDGGTLLIARAELRELTEKQRKELFTVAANQPKARFVIYGPAARGDPAFAHDLFGLRNVFVTDQDLGSAYRRYGFPGKAAVDVLTGKLSRRRVRSAMPFLRLENTEGMIAMALLYVLSDGEHPAFVRRAGELELRDRAWLESVRDYLSHQVVAWSA
ncbi:MAG: SAM-dependent methyltransferase [Candidatus Omnitrophota bacterium]